MTVTDTAHRRARRGQEAVDTALDLITNFSQGNIDPDLLADYSPGSKGYASTWEKVVTAAEAFNDPGTFSAIIGFEWTSLVKGNKLHRNVIFRDGAEKTGQVMPFTTQTPVGNTVDLERANRSNTIGAAKLGAVWTDPEFDPKQRAFYYARVIEMPTPRWIVYDTFRYGIDLPADATTTHQERAYTSPIWYTPKA